MNSREKEVIQAGLKDEKHTIKQLERIYDQARKDCEAKIAELNARTDLQNIQSIVYQRQYQEALKRQLDGVLDIHDAALGGSQVLQVIPPNQLRLFSPPFFNCTHSLSPLVLPVAPAGILTIFSGSGNERSPLSGPTPTSGLPKYEFCVNVSKRFVLLDDSL